ncbi:hypothetical protein E1A91_D07G160600v1 [Gossypium mustelinum]|uniref:XPG N-terminal domain-containing protein n=1 Tax=Gossypium mustelinum TaxID=34275 RepID=A0A5D2UAU7_GOSMU|nr:hypothetical protein E1A91_D07G160600v1 [Gossypium mustelinum]
MQIFLFHLWSCLRRYGLFHFLFLKNFKIRRLAVDAILMAEGAERKEHMGIKGLTKLLADNAPKAMKEQKLESYFGRKIAIDASMSIYQFLIVVGRIGTEMLTNEAGEVTKFLIYFSLHSLILFYLKELSLADSYFIFLPFQLNFHYLVHKMFTWGLLA